MANDDIGLRMTIRDPAELGDTIKARTHWLIGFAPGTEPAIDEFDQRLDHYPTYSTVLMRSGSLTIVPKLEVARDRLADVLEVMGGERESLMDPERDIFIIAVSKETNIAMLNELDRIRGAV